MGQMNVPLPILALLLFNMIGPIALLPLFARSMAGGDAPLRNRVALRAALFALVTLAVAVFVGATVMQSVGTSRSSLIIAAGIILTWTALQNIFGGSTATASLQDKPTIGLALMPIAIPGIVTPMGVAILILFASYFPDLRERFAILAVIGGIIVANYLAMMSAHWFMRTIGPTPLIVLGAIFGVLQVALGIEMIVSGIGLSRLFVQP